VRPKGGSEIKKKGRNNDYFCYADGIRHVWIRRRTLQSAAENINYGDLFITYTEIGIGTASCLKESGLQNSLAWKSDPFE